ncbi:MAG: hypothetical protein IJL06_04945 [Kiritimatiellae bacterium]|nr:hypothetical protein [Kiritimatiellia bacterium]
MPLLIRNGKLVVKCGPALAISCNCCSGSATLRVTNAVYYDCSEMWDHRRLGLEADIDEYELADAAACSYSMVDSNNRFGRMTRYDRAAGGGWTSVGVRSIEWASTQNPYAVATGQTEVRRPTGAADNQTHCSVFGATCALLHFAKPGLGHLSFAIGKSNCSHGGAGVVLTLKAEVTGGGALHIYLDGNTSVGTYPKRINDGNGDYVVTAATGAKIFTYGYTYAAGGNPVTRIVRAAYTR